MIDRDRMLRRLASVFGPNLLFRRGACALRNEDEGQAMEVWAELVGAGGERTTVSMLLPPGGRVLVSGPDELGVIVRAVPYGGPGRWLLAHAGLRLSVDRQRVELAGEGDVGAPLLLDPVGERDEVEDEL